MACTETLFSEWNFPGNTEEKTYLADSARISVAYLHIMSSPTSFESRIFKMDHSS